MQTHPKVDDFLENAKKWQDEMILMRKFALECLLSEDFKWMHPCYTMNGSNVLIIHGFKEYVALNFFNGVLLKDEENVLIQQTENVQAARQMRFTSYEEIVAAEKRIKAYILEAIALEKEGVKVQLKKTEEFNVPEELTATFEIDSEYKNAFEALTPGRQRGYLLHFAGAKQVDTRIARIEKNKKRILDGFGLTDCTCGMSKKKPSCDGSHKFIDNHSY